MYTQDVRSVTRIVDQKANANNGLSVSILLAGRYFIFYKPPEAESTTELMHHIIAQLSQCTGFGLSRRPDGLKTALNSSKHRAKD